MYSNECAKCPNSDTCDQKYKDPDWIVEDMGCPILLAENLREQGERVNMIEV